MEKRRCRDGEKGEEEGVFLNRSLGMAPPGPFSEKASQRIRNYTNTVPGPWKSGRLEVSTLFCGEKPTSTRSMQIEQNTVE